MSKDIELTLRINADGRATIQTVKKVDKVLGGMGKCANQILAGEHIALLP